MSSAFPPPARPDGLAALYARPLPWLLLLAAAHVAVRVAISPSLQWDEAQQILWSQDLALGYGPQPPLYTWLQWGVEQWRGPSVLALALLKHALMALVCVFAWLAARELMGRRAAWWAAAGVWLMPPFGWDSVNDRTHTVLITAMVFAAWWLLLRIVRLGGQGCRREFAALGLVCGCGMLAKYNFALVLAAFAVALLPARGPRRALFGPGWWWAALIGLALFAPHGGWLLGHWREATAATVEKMQITPQSHWLAGLADLLTTTLGTLTLWAVFALAAFGSAWWRRPAGPAQVISDGSGAQRPAAPPPWLGPAFGRYLALMAAALLFMVLAENVTAFRNYWVLPLVAPAPLMAFALRPRLDADPRGWRLTGLTLAVIALVLIAAATRSWRVDIDGKVQPANYPALELAQALREAGYDGRGRIIASDNLLAGILHTRFPAARAVDCGPKQGDVAACVTANAEQAERAGQGWLLISFAGKTEPDWWPDALASPIFANAAPPPRRHLLLAYRLARPGHAPASYDFIWRPAP
jgi:4-amino-4-deoxy-L-arabinose transferase-like glycosyltransferase